MGWVSEAPRLSASVTEQTRRIVDENASPRRVVGREFEQQIEEIPVVRHSGGIEIGRMRPIAAPDHALGCGGDEGLGEWNDIGIGRTVPGQAVGAREFDPDMLFAHQV